MRTMSQIPQVKIPATYLRGGTSKGVFFSLQDLPESARAAGPARDALLLRVIGSPDPYGKQTDGMGGATSSTSKAVIISKSSQPDHDVDYLFRFLSTNLLLTGVAIAAIFRRPLAPMPSLTIWSTLVEFRTTVLLKLEFGKRTSRKQLLRMFP